MPELPGVAVAGIKEKIDSVRETIGRNVSIYTPTRNACVRCTVSGFYDATSDKSISFTCPECKGFFWKREFTETVILARVHWTSNEAIAVTPGGKYFSGDAYIHVDPEYHTLLQTAQNGGKVVVDGQEMSIIRINPVGAPVTNRYRAILKGAGSQPQG
jgi:hypothetical protein